MTASGKDRFIFKLDNRVAYLLGLAIGTVVFARDVLAILAAHPRIVIYQDQVLDNSRVEICWGYCRDALPGQDVLWGNWRCDQKSAPPEWIRRRGSFELR